MGLRGKAEPLLARQFGDRQSAEGSGDELHGEGGDDSLVGTAGDDTITASRTINIETRIGISLESDPDGAYSPPASIHFASFVMAVTVAA